MDKDLRGLLDRLEISELRSKYCWYMVRRNIEKVTQLYTADLLFEVQWGGERRTVIGRDGLRAFFSNAASDPPNFVVPLIHNEVTFIDGDEARGVCCMEVRTSNADTAFLSGYYHDRFRREDGKWLFAERRYYRYLPNFERSGLEMDGSPEAAS
jgi:SnoaL-like domain